LFRGVGVALVTLFDGSGELDAPATAGHAARLVAKGIKAVLVAGTTGEAGALEPAERTQLLAAVRNVLPGPGDAVLIAGTGAPSTRQATRLTAAARDAGADAVLALSPAGCTDSRPYYEAVVAAARDIPVLAYHFPRASSPGIAVEALPDLPVAGMKDSSGDAGRLPATLSSWDRPVYPGSSTLTLLAASLGCPGVILALANAEPEACVAAFAGDAGAQLKMAEYRAAEARPPLGIKQLTAARFGCSATARLG
jgi:dihydrodipicolinate synthase/N-acetylneuraminate lyase